ncbi:MAG: hypothetical protein ACO294_12885 [Methylococcales bacterium]
MIVDILNRFIKWVNGFGEPKVVNAIIKHESISAIKIKVKPIEEYKESPWVKNEKKESKGNNIVTGTTQNKAHMLGTYVDMNGLSSTSMYHNENLDDILLGGYNMKPVDITPKKHSKKTK